MKAQHWTKKEINFLKKEYKSKNKTLSQNLDRTIGAIAKKKYQLELKHSNKWTEEEIILELKNLNKKIGHSPSVREVSQKLYQATLRFFGSFNNAKNKANLKTSRPKHHQIKKDIKKVTKELAYILGVIHGDGYCYIRKSKLRTSAIIGLHVKDKDFADNFKEVLGRWSGIKAKEYNNHSEHYVALYSIDCAKIIKDVNVKNVLRQNRQVRIYFLRGMYDSEGGVIAKNLECRRKAKRWIHFSNSKIKTINLVKTCLDSLCITYKIRPGVHSGFGSKRQQYELLIYNKEGMRNFYKYVGFSIKRKQKELVTLINSFEK
ncbi:MAG: hypothetical protein NTX24_01215 [Candidatus Pacearchaeota archaeon]|nr:hypothetical protein [Candidatus Pacearchaeota archaeon]